MPLNDEISAAIRPIIEATGNYLEELSITSAGKVKILTVIIDSDSHLNLDQVTAVTKEISDNGDDTLNNNKNLKFTVS